MSLEIMHGSFFAGLNYTAAIFGFKKPGLGFLALLIRAVVGVFTIDRHGGINDRGIFCMGTTTMLFNASRTAFSRSLPCDRLGLTRG